VATREMKRHLTVPIHRIAHLLQQLVRLQQSQPFQRAGNTQRMQNSVLFVSISK
jgi:hypothetical protein